MAGRAPADVPDLTQWAGATRPAMITGWFMQTVHLTHFYDASPARVWRLATDFDALQHVMRKIIVFEGLPTGQITAGQQIDVRVSLFGKLPWQPYHMQLLDFDEPGMSFRSSEHGAGVKSWVHTLTVTPHGEGGACLTDQIEIAAPPLTPLFAQWAKFLYKSRHKPRQALLADGTF